MVSKENCTNRNAAKLEISNEKNIKNNSSNVKIFLSKSCQRGNQN